MIGLFTVNSINHPYNLNITLSYHIDEIENGWNVTYQIKIKYDNDKLDNPHCPWIVAFIRKDGFWQSEEQVVTMLKNELELMTKRYTNGK
mgnify:CR=1 FL=1